MIDDLGADDSARAAKLLVRSALDSLRRQETDLLEEHRRREEEFRNIERLRLKSYEKMPPTQAEHLKSWQTARDLHLKALANWTAETDVQAAIAAALQPVSDPAAIVFLDGEGLKSARAAKHASAAFVAIVKCLPRSRTEAQAEGVFEWARATDSADVRVLAPEWIRANRPPMERLARATGGRYVSVGDEWAEEVRDANPHGDGRKEVPVALWRNTPARGRDWLELDLEGAPGKSNRLAIGARVRVSAGGRTLMREVLSATGRFGLAPSRRLHFGLGDHAKVGQVTMTVRWPDREGSVQEFRDVAPNRRYRLRQGDDAPTPER